MSNLATTVACAAVTIADLKDRLDRARITERKAEDHARCAKGRRARGILPEDDR